MTRNTGDSCAIPKGSDITSPHTELKKERTKTKDHASRQNSNLANKPDGRQKRNRNQLRGSSLD